MITLDALQPRLRQLKLSGMRDAIGSRAEEARTRGLDPLEFLALLLDDELARREADGLAPPSPALRSSATYATSILATIPKSPRHASGS